MHQKGFMKKIWCLLVVTFLGVGTVMAETIWCKTMKLGCTTPEDRAKAMQLCQKMGDDSYREGLAQALGDPRVWQSAGMNNAYEYAAMRKRGMMDICIKKSPELSR
jgi:hypothetical protein